MRFTRGWGQSARLVKAIIGAQFGIYTPYPIFNPYGAIVSMQSLRSLQMRAVALFGDSRVAGLATSTLSMPAENFGIGGDTLEGLIFRVGRYELSRATAVFVGVGVNDWLGGSLANFEKRFPALLSAFPSDIPVVVSAILPVARRALNGRPSLSKIGDANETIQLICEEYPNATFLPCPPQILDRAELRAEMSAADGIHLNVDGAFVWLAHIEAALRTVLRASQVTGREPGASLAQ